MLARRLLIVIAVLIGLTALAAGVAPRPRPTADTPPPAVAAKPAPAPLERTIQASGEGQRVLARVGQTVILTVEADSLDTVSLAEHGNEPVDLDSPARFDLLADVPGSYAIELLESERTIGTLEVREAG